MPYSLAELNQMSEEEFTQALGAVFEKTPAIAQKAWHKRPFTSLLELHQAMMEVVYTSSIQEQLALMQAHPNLGNKAKMAQASAQEQASARLDQLTPEEYKRLQKLNAAYQEKFGFPFIIAVKNHTKASIFEAFSHRLSKPREFEKEQAIAEIAKITWFRLQPIVSDPETSINQNRD